MREWLQREIGSVRAGRLQAAQEGAGTETKEGAEEEACDAA